MERSITPVSQIRRGPPPTPGAPPRPTYTTSPEARAISAVYSRPLPFEETKGEEGPDYETNVAAVGPDYETIVAAVMLAALREAQGTSEETKSDHELDSELDAIWQMDSQDDSTVTVTVSDASRTTTPTTSSSDRVAPGAPPRPRRRRPNGVPALTIPLRR